MAQVVKDKFTAKMDEPFVVFMIGMWLPLHKDPSTVDREMIRTRPVRSSHDVFTI